MSHDKTGHKSRADVAEFIAKIKNPDPDVHYAAWRAAGPIGAGAVEPLADLVTSDDKGVAKAAKGALDTIAYYAARPGGGGDAHAVSVELLKVADSKRPTRVRAQALHLLGFTGDNHVVGGMAKLLNDADVREEARMALERIPGSASMNALKKAEKNAAPEFKPNLDQSLHDFTLTPQNVGTQK